MSGGKRPGAGRKKGTPNKATAKRREIAEKALDSGITPLDYMLQVMRQEVPEGASAEQKASIVGMRFEAAKAAAPYVHPRLAAIEHTGEGGGPIKTDSKITIAPDEAYKRMLEFGKSK